MKVIFDALNGLMNTGITIDGFHFTFWNIFYFTWIAGGLIWFIKKLFD